MKLSIVTTLYYSESYIDDFYRRICETARQITDNFEIIFVNDGSPDNSLQKATALHARDPRITVVELSRNFGHHRAMMTGLTFASGEYVFLIDVDLEEKPEWLLTFWNELMSRKSADVVYGVQKTRRGKFPERIMGSLFYWFINKLTDLDMPANVTTARLMNRTYVDALTEYREQEIFIAGLWACTGFNQSGIEVIKESHSETTYNLSRKLKIAVNSVTSFSSLPLVYIFYLGLAVALISFLAVIYLVIIKVFFSIPVAGWTSIVASIWLVGGLIIFSIGIIGIYLSKIFLETKNRPYSTVRQLLRGAGFD